MQRKSGRGGAEKEAEGGTRRKFKTSDLRSKGGILARLDDYGTASSQGWSDLACNHGKRKVPWSNACSLQREGESKVRAILQQRRVKRESNTAADSSYSAGAEKYFGGGEGGGGGGSYSPMIANQFIAYPFSCFFFPPLTAPI